MATTRDLLTRIAEALERLAPLPPPRIDWQRFPAYRWDGASAHGLARIAAPALALLQGIGDQKTLVTANIARLAAGVPAHDMLLWGARGMGKSALLRAAVAAEQAKTDARTGGPLALVQVPGAVLGTLSTLFAALGQVPDRRFLVFLDDLGFEEDDTTTARGLRSWLEGGVEARPANIALAVTANQRAILARHAAEQADPLNPRDAIDDRLALADRFGLAIGFHVCSQEDYLAIIAGYAEVFGLAWQPEEALAWARRRGGRSGRVAWQFITELAGRAGQPLRGDTAG